jgi:hypothetical protein
MSRFSLCKFDSFLYIIEINYLIVKLSQGLKHYARHQDYVDVCYDTVYALQGIPSKHGKCINKKTGKLHSPCICKFILFLYEDKII